MIYLKCWHYDAKNKDDRDNCINCRHWAGKKCKDEALIIAEWDKVHGAYEYMMRDNKGLRM